MACSFYEVACIAETSKAIRVVINEKPYWIPKSQVDDDSEVFSEGDFGTLVVSDWWAEKEGLE